MWTPIIDYTWKKAESDQNVFALIIISKHNTNNFLKHRMEVIVLWSW